MTVIGHGTKGPNKAQHSLRELMPEGSKSGQNEQMQPSEGFSWGERGDPTGLDERHL